LQPDELQDQNNQDEEAEEDKGYDISDQEEGTLNLHHGSQEPDTKSQAEHDAIEDHHIGIDDDGVVKSADELRQEAKARKSKSKKKEAQLAPESTVTPEVRLPNIDGSAYDGSGGYFVGQKLDEPEPEEPQQREIDPEEAKAREILEKSGLAKKPSGGPPKIVTDHKSSEYLDHPPTTNAEENFGMPTEEGVQESPYAKYMKPSEKPANPSSRGDEKTAQQLDPLDIPSAGPLAFDPKKSTADPMIATQHDAESQRATEVGTTESTMLSSDGDSDPKKISAQKEDEDRTKPLAPVAGDQNTLEEIEGRVKNFEGVDELHKPNPVDQARMIVDQAASSQKYEDNHPPQFESKDQAPGFIPEPVEQPLPPPTADSVVTPVNQESQQPTSPPAPRPVAPEDRTTLPRPAGMGDATPPPPGPPPFIPTAQ
jgi:hypothetical protein